MTQRLAGGIFIVLALCQSVYATGIQVPFDHVYPVSSAGSTTPVTEFDVNGPAPWVYLDLPSPGAQYSYGSSNWFADSNPTAKFLEYSPGVFVSEGEYWLSPPADVWQQTKSAGTWHVDASFAWWDLVIIYGGGAPVTKTYGSQTVNFNVLNTGDANGDGRVDVTDLGTLATNYSRPGTWWDGDFTRDGMVDVSDLGMLATHWGFGTDGSGPSFSQAMSAFPVLSGVPEPAILAPLGSVLLLARGRARWHALV